MCVNNQDLWCQYEVRGAKATGGSHDSILWSCDPILWVCRVTVQDMSANKGS